ncbi:MAG: serine hydrolase [Myxococcales bacterium]|nr:serine hydrolase [Myxococcales bacterium]
MIRALPALLALLPALALAKAPPLDTALLPRLFAQSQDPALAPVLADPATFRAQVLYSRVVKDKQGRPTLERHGWRVDAEYTYPASAMKTLAAVAAYQRFRALRAQHRWLRDTTPLAFHPVFDDEKLDDVDPSNARGRHITLRQLMRRMAIVSSNYAFNRLYDLAGQQAVNQVAWDAGLKDTLVLHRLSRLMPLAEHRRHPAIELRGPKGQTVTLPAHVSGVDQVNPADLPGITAGRAERLDGALVQGPKSFVDKNRMSVPDLQHMLAFIVRPDVRTGLPGFKDLHPKDRALLQTAMRQRPGESKNPRLSEDRYDPNRFKPSRPGLLRVLPEDRFHLYNKAGKAYGFRIENAYIEDRQTKAGFFLTVAIYVNANGILNDGKYEYDEVADPFIHAVAELCARHAFGLKAPATGAQTPR